MFAKANKLSSHIVFPNWYSFGNGKREQTVAQLIEALRYKPEGRRLIPDGVTGMFH